MTSHKNKSDQSQTNSSSIPSLLMQASSGPIQSIKECKICLASQKETPQLNLIQPCKCSGSLKHVHQECLKQWIRNIYSEKNNQEKKVLEQQGLICQLCKQHIKFNVGLTCGVKSSQDRQKAINQHPIIFGFYIFVFIMSIVGIVLCVFFITRNANIEKRTSVDQLQKTLTFFGLVATSFFFAIDLVIFVFQYILERKVQIKSIEDQKCLKLKLTKTLTHRIIPIEQETICNIGNNN